MKLKNVIYISKFFVLLAIFFSGLSASAQPTLQHFTPVFNTGGNALAVIPLTATPNIGGIPLQAGDEIAIFTTGGLCAGAIAWTDTGNVAIAVWGDNIMTPATDGMLVGEQLRWRVWRQANNTEYNNVTVVYTAGGFFNSTGNYAPNAIYFLTSLVATPSGLEVGLTASRDTVCQGGSTNLSALVVGGTPPFSYSWQSRPLGGTYAPMTGVQSSSHTVNNINNNTEFRVIVTDSQQRSRTTSTIVYAVQPPVLAITGSSTVCRTFQQQYSTILTQGDSLRWTASGGIIVEGATSANATVVWQTSPATLSLTYYSSICGVLSTSLTVQSFTEPTPRIIGTQQTCRQSTYRYSTPSPTTNTFSWSVVGGTILDGLGTTSVTVQWITSVTLGTITLTESNSICPNATTSLSVIIAEPPRAAISGTSAVCNGDTTMYRAPNRAGDMYQWTISGGRMLSSATADSVQVVWESSTIASIISLQITSPWCGTTSSSLVIDVAPLPNPTIIATTTYCAQNIYTFQARGNGGNYQWNVTGADIIGASTGATMQVRTGTGATFSVELREISSRCGIASTTSIFTIQPLPHPQISGQQTVCAFSTGAVYSVTPTTSHSYQWSVSGGRITSGQSTATIIVEWFGSSNGTVQILQTSPFCGSSTASRTINILPLPIPSIAGNTTVCANSQGNTYSVENITGTTYQWEAVGGTITSSSTSPTISVTWQNAGIGAIRVHQTSVLCGTFSDTLTILKSAQIQPRVTGRETVCPQTIAGYSVGLTAGDSYRWSVEGGNIIGREDSATVLVSWGATAPYRLTVEQTSPICGSGTTTLTLKAANTDRPLITGNTQVCKESIEQYKLSNAALWQQATWQVTGGTILAFTENDVTIRWSNNGTINIVAQSTEGCIQVNNLTVLVEELPVPELADLPIACINLPIRYVVKNYQTGLQTSWEVVGGTLLEQSDSTIFVQWQDSNGELLCWFISSSCTGDTIRQQIIPASRLQAEILQGDTIFTEQGKSLQLDLAVSGGNPAERIISWEAEAEIEQLSAIAVQLTPTTTTTVRAIISDGDFCADTVLTTIFVTPPVSVVELDNNNILQLNLFPIPAASNLTIRTTTLRKGMPIRIVLYNNAGLFLQEIYQGIIMHNTFDIVVPVDLLTNGIYTVGIISFNGIIYKQVPIIK